MNIPEVVACYMLSEKIDRGIATITECGLKIREFFHTIPTSACRLGTNLHVGMQTAICAIKYVSVPN